MTGNRVRTNWKANIRRHYDHRRASPLTDQQKQLVEKKLGVKVIEEPTQVYGFYSTEDKVKLQDILDCLFHRQMLLFLGTIGHNGQPTYYTIQYLGYTNPDRLFRDQVRLAIEVMKRHIPYQKRGNYRDDPEFLRYLDYCAVAQILAEAADVELQDIIDYLWSRRNNLDSTTIDLVARFDPYYES